MGARLTPEERRQKQRDAKNARERERREALDPATVQANREKRRIRDHEREQMAMDRANAHATTTTPTPVAPPAPLPVNIINESRRIGREPDLWYQVQLKRYSHRPSQWTDEQRTALAEFLAKFIRPDGTPQPVPKARQKHHAVIARGGVPFHTDTKDKAP